MLSLLLSISVAWATHVTTYEPDVLRTTGPLAGMESLVVEPQQALSQLKPLAAQPGVGVEVVANGAIMVGGEGAKTPEETLIFTNPVSTWCWLTLNGTKIGTINPYATITFTGVKSGWYQIDLHEPNGFERHLAVLVGPPAPPPPPPDTDGDGILDSRDKCINEPETRNGYRDRDGCPDEVPAEVKKYSGAIQGITFETGKNTLKTSSDQVLMSALKVLQDFPDVRMEIQGHTDNVGDDAQNMALSQARADAVRQWFIDHGIAADRLIAKGYGETQPVADNATPDGQAQNRRVEFKLLE